MVSSIPIVWPIGAPVARDIHSAGVRAPSSAQTFVSATRGRAVSRHPRRGASSPRAARSDPSHPEHQPAPGPDHARTPAAPRPHRAQHRTRDRPGDASWAGGSRTRGLPSDGLAPRHQAGAPNRHPGRTSDTNGGRVTRGFRDPGQQRHPTRTYVRCQGGPSKNLPLRPTTESCRRAACRDHGPARRASSMCAAACAS